MPVVILLLALNNNFGSGLFGQNPRICNMENWAWPSRSRKKKRLTLLTTDIVGLDLNGSCSDSLHRAAKRGREAERTRIGCSQPTTQANCERQTQLDVRTGHWHCILAFCVNVWVGFKRSSFNTTTTTTTTTSSFTHSSINQFIPKYRANHI